MKSLPFAVQLSLIVFLILIIPFIILMSYTGSTTLKFSEEEIARSSLEDIELNRRFTTLRNEMDILSSAFTHIENKEKELKFLLIEREKDAGKLLRFLENLQELAGPVFGTTITIGLSETGFDLDGIHQCGT